MFAIIFLFTERLNVSIVSPTRDTGLLSAEEEQRVKDAQQKHRKLLKIPRRCEMKVAGWDTACPL